MNSVYVEKLPKPDDSTDVRVTRAPSAKNTSLDTKEKLTIKSGIIVFTLEAGVGNMTTPLIITHAQLSADITNWSNDVS